MKQELIEKRTRNSKTCSLGGGKFSWDGTIGSIHYEDSGWQEIDNYFEPAVAPWNWQMLKAGYHIRVKEGFTAGQIIEFGKQGATVQFQPMALEWTNDLDMIQQISMPQSVIPTITNPEVDLLPDMTSHQGTIRWDDGYGEGIDLEWRCTSTRLVKILEVENLNKLPMPEQYIFDGGNPVLRLNLIFDPSSGVDIYVDGGLWDKKSKEQTFGVIEFHKDGEVLWGFMPLRYWDSGESSGQSIATLEKRGNKFYISIRVPYEWLQSAAYPVFIDTDVSETVGAGNDNCWTYRGYDAFYLDPNSYVRLGMANNADPIFRQDAGFRFQTVNIAQGLTIDIAYLTFRAYAADTGTTCNLNVKCEAIDDAPEFSDRADFYARDRTALATWDGLGSWVIDSDYNSDSIVTPIQAVIDRGGWEANFDLVVFVEDDDSDQNAERLGDSQNGDATYCARLHIEYEAEAPPVTEAYGYVV